MGIQPKTEKLVTLGVVYSLALLPSIAMLFWLFLGFDDAHSGFAFTFNCPFSKDSCEWQTFNWHPLLMTFAFLTLFSQAICAFKLLPFKHATSKLIHFGIQTCGLLCALAGFIIVITFKFKTDNYQFYTAHSYLGLLGVVFFVIQYAVGFISFLFPKLPDKPRATVHSFHIFAGFSIYVLTLTAIFTGIADREIICGGFCGMDVTTYYNYSWIGGNLVIILGIITAVSVFWAHRPPTKRELYAKKHAIDEEEPILQTNH